MMTKERLQVLLTRYLQGVESALATMVIDAAEEKAMQSIINKLRVGENEASFRSQVKATMEGLRLRMSTPECEEVIGKMAGVKVRTSEGIGVICRDSSFKSGISVTGHLEPWVLRLSADEFLRYNPLTCLHIWKRVSQ